MISLKQLPKLLAATAFAVSATSASAVTYSFLNDGRDDRSSIDFGDFTVSASFEGLVLSGDADIVQSDTGLGVKNFLIDSPDVDGRTRNDTLTFSFDSEVTLTEIVFSRFDGNDDYVLSFDGGPGTSLGDNPWTGSQTLSVFSLEAVGRNDDWRVVSISYDLAPVPLPASSLLLLAGLAGLGVTRSRTKKQNA